LLLSQLRRARMVEATRGKNGGYVLSRKPTDITVWDIVSIFEGRVIFAQPEMPPNGKKSPAVYGAIWKEAEKKVVDHLKAVRISELLEAITSGKEMYFI